VGSLFISSLGEKLTVYDIDGLLQSIQDGVIPPNRVRTYLSANLSCIDIIVSFLRTLITLALSLDSLNISSIHPNQSKSSIRSSVVYSLPLDLVKSEV
jgi:hypothetical protein